MVFLLIAFLDGVAGAFQIPTLSLYLSTELNASLAAVGRCHAVNAAIGIGVRTLSDRLKVRRHLLMFCYLMVVLNSLAFASAAIIYFY
ncbi:hypothetical protein EB241_14630 [Erwinia psidii]|uniref:Uncharacterized protein n=1 Tax=Erwinia psidii TaxID=69224 RepID=A0A3N6UNG8_9GAMM|nr:hypothetical protein EB241_14630 [Erwinia psidii]